MADSIEELKLAWPGRLIAHVAEGEGTASGDADRLAQVVTNLAANALTYGTPDQPVAITSSITARELSIRVHNAGTPIPAELVPHLFEPLRRGEQQIKLGSRSVGLGLYIVQQIVLAHAGQVTVHSTQLEGTTISVIIPMPDHVASA